MKPVFPIPLVAGLLLATSFGLPLPAHAQSDCATQAKKRRPSLFGAEGAGGLLTRLQGAARGQRNLGTDIKDTAQRGAEQRASEAATVAGCKAAEKTQSAPSQATDGAQSPPQSAPEPPVRRQAESDVQYPSRMEIPREWRTAKDAYTEFGKVRCTGCEGGFAYSGWPSWPRDQHSGKHGGDERRLADLAIGHVHRWTANGFAGSLRVDSEEEVNGFRCRKMTYRLEKDGKSAERPGLICWGKSNQFAASESWVGVF